MLCPSGVRGEDAPADLAKRIAQRESKTQVARNDYTYRRKSVELQELDERGARGNTKKPAT